MTQPLKPLFSKDGPTDEGKKLVAIAKELRSKGADLKLDTIVYETKAYNFTELGNAERFADRYHSTVRFVSEWRRWIVWDGKRWKPVSHEEVRRLAHNIIKGLYALAAEQNDQDLAAKYGKWAATSSRSAAFTAMLKEAASIMAISADSLDVNPWLFNCNNCTINLQTGQEQAHFKDDFITKKTPVDFNPEAQAPLFESVLHTCLDGKPKLKDFLQRMAGYSTSGSIREQCLFILYGHGANGKSTILNIISEALGEYAQTTRPETLMVKRPDAIPSDLAKLKGARFVTAAEAEDGHRLAESQIKLMTGGERIQARALYQDWFEYNPEFKIVLCTNHKPIIRGQDHAIWRRIRLVPFTVTIPEEQRDKNLPDKLRKELPGILSWIVAGARMWLTDGLGTPEEVQTATDEYRSEQNIINNFLEACCTIKENVSVEAGQLFKTFDEWRQQEGQRKITQTKFGRMLVELGYEKSRSTATGRINYQEIGLNQ